MVRRLALCMCMMTAAAVCRADVIDAFRYAGPDAAANAWRAGPSTSPVQISGSGLIFPVTFSDGRDRVYWDRDIDLNLSESVSIELQLSCDRPDAMRSLSVYFRSGDGWYIWNQPLSSAGRQKLLLQKSDFQTEGRPAGWHRIDRIRISPWMANPVDARLILHAMTTRNDRLFLIRPTGTSIEKSERGIAERTLKRIGRWLNGAGIPYAVLNDTELASACARPGVIILPYNPRIPEKGIQSLRSFVKKGGRLMAFYSSDSQLADLMKIKPGEVTNTRDIARFRSISFNRHAPPGTPAVIHQQSWNIGTARPAGRGARIIAHWADASGRVSSDAAVIESPSGYWFTHILLDDDNRAKQRMLTALLGKLDPGIWRDAAEHALLNAGRIDGWPDALSAIRALTAMAEGHPNHDTLLAFIRRIESRNRSVQLLYGQGEYLKAVSAGYELTDTLIRAYGLAQRSSADEIRAVWDHDGTGWYPGDWEKTARLLAESGINTVFVNGTWAGLAHYRSSILPESFTYRYYRDQLEQAVAACRKYGIKVHAWIVCWYLENAPAEFRAPLKGTGRLQAYPDGRERWWMNPAHPDNQKHHLAVIREIIDRYDVDGIHLDYIRYPDSDGCFSSYTRRTFSADTGVTPDRWPEDVLPGGADRQAFVRWRAANITDFVRQARALTRLADRPVQLSAAVWGGYPQIIDPIGQDWMTWLERDYVDFLCPMNYANEVSRFTALLDQQLTYPAARGKLVPGIGVTANESQLRSDQVIEQILALRKRSAAGFALFDLSQTLVDDTLPALRIGVTAPLPSVSGN